jgi:AraC-like DNA-binding protein
VSTHRESIKSNVDQARLKHIQHLGGMDVLYARYQQHTYLGPFYFARVFQQAVGLPPYTYLVQRRVEKARQLIRNKLPLTQGALSVGFYDQSHLNRNFKNFLGVTPTQYQTFSK